MHTQVASFDAASVLAVSYSCPMHQLFMSSINFLPGIAWENIVEELQRCLQVSKEMLLGENSQIWEDNNDMITNQSAYLIPLISERQLDSHAGVGLDG